MTNFFTQLSLKQKLTILFSFIISFISLFMSIYVPESLEEIFLKSIKDKIQVIAEMTAYSITPALVFNDEESIQQNFQSANQLDELLYIVVMKDDKIIASSRFEKAMLAEYLKTGVDMENSIIKTNIDIIHQEKFIATLYIALSLENVKQEISDARNAMFTLSILLFLLGVSAVMIISSYLTKPINKFVESIKEISSGNLSKRVNINSEDEIGTLASSFDEMLDKLQNAYDRLDEFNKTLEKRVTERTQELKISEERFKSLYNNTPVMLHSMDQAGRILSVNEFWLSNSGYQRDEVIGKNFVDFLSEDSRREAEVVCYPNFMKKGFCKDVPFNMIKKNGENIDILLSAISEKNGNGNVTRGLAVIIDVTEKKKMIEELIVAKENAEEMNRAKSSFFTNMSHELRTPLIAILGFSEILAEEIGDNTEAVNLANRINSGGKRLLETLNLILNLSKYESGKIEVNIQSENIVELLDNLYQQYSSVATLKKLKFLFQPANENILCNVDSKLFDHIFGNLINNALKFTAVGYVIISVEKDTLDGVIKISDTGIGIPIEKQKIIWDEFRQSSEGYGRTYEGTGLGLTIAKKYTELIHGKISVESEEGKGSTFTVRFPLS